MCLSAWLHPKESRVWKGIYHLLMSLYHWEEVKMKCIIIINDIYLMVCTTTQVQHHTSGIYVQKSIGQCSGYSNMHRLIHSSLSPIVAWWIPGVYTHLQLSKLITLDSFSCCVAKAHAQNAETANDDALQDSSMKTHSSSCQSVGFYRKWTYFEI